LDVPAVPAIDPWGLTAEPHFAENNLWIMIEQPDLGNLTLPASVLGRGHIVPAPACGAANDRANVWATPSR